MEEKLKELIKQIKLFLKNNFHNQSEYLPYFISIAFSLILFSVGVNIFLEIAEDLAAKDLQEFDYVVSNFIIAQRTDSLTKIFMIITKLGDYYSYFILTTIISLILILRHKNWKFVLQIAIVNILAFVINFLLKGYYQRERPAQEHLVEATYLSFPSGHAMSGAAFYSFIIYLSVRYFKTFRWKFLTTFICIVLILSIGISRIYLGVHYPSDVLAGFIAGLFWVAFCIIIFNILGLIRKRKSAKKYVFPSG